MLRKIVTFAFLMLLVGALASLVYLNPQPTPVQLTPQHRYEPSLGYLILLSTAVGAVLVFLVFLLREGRWALRQWRVQREKRVAERNADYKAEARSLMLGGQCNRARSLLAKATKRGEPTVGDLIDYAETYLQEGNVGGARSALEEGIRDFGSDPLLLHALGGVCHRLGDEAAAAAALERAASSYPSSVSVHALLRDVLVAMRSWKRAEEVQLRLVELKPGDGDEKRRLVELRFRTVADLEGGERDAALKAILSMDADYSPAVAERVRSLNAAGSPRPALRLLDKALKRSPTPALLDVLEDLLGPDQEPKLLKTLAKLSEAHPDEQALKLRIVRRLLDGGRIDEAEASLAGIDIERVPVEGLRLRARIHEHRGQAERAAETYREALDAALT